MNLSLNQIFISIVFIQKIVTRFTYNNNDDSKKIGFILDILTNLLTIERLVQDE